MAQLDFLTFFNQLTWLVIFFSIFYYTIRSNIVEKLSTLYGLRELLKNPKNFKSNNILFFKSISLLFIKTICLKTQTLSTKLNKLSFSPKTNTSSFKTMFLLNKKTYH